MTFIPSSVSPSPTCNFPLHVEEMKRERGQRRTGITAQNSNAGKRTDRIIWNFETKKYFLKSCENGRNPMSHFHCEKFSRNIACNRISQCFRLCGGGFGRKIYHVTWDKSTLVGIQKHSFPVNLHACSNFLRIKNFKTTFNLFTCLILSYCMVYRYSALKLFRFSFLH